MANIIAEIHDSDVYGIFVETGCGCPVASNLYSVGGASKTVYKSEQPYSAEYARIEYGIDDSIRAVSKEYISKVIDKYVLYTKSNPRINTIYVSSFQIGNNNDIVTHGWIGLKYKETLKFYHVTIRASLPRSGYITEIGNIGTRLLWLRNQLPMDRMGLSVDMMIDTDVYDPIGTLKLMSDDGYICFDKHIPVRIENIIRGSSKLIVYKGSFNPPTLAHIDLAVKTLAEYPNANIVFMISMETVDKGTLSQEDVLRRVKWINSLGYTCVVNMAGKFGDAIKFYNTHFPQVPIVFPVGHDTYVRMESDLFKMGPMVEFKVFPRTEVSSTRVRKAIESGDSETIKSLVSPIIWATLIPQL